MACETEGIIYLNDTTAGLYSNSILDLAFDLEGAAWVATNDGLYRYEDLCARYNNYCYDNEILGLSDLIPSVEVKEVNLTYPVYFDPYTFQVRGIKSRLK